MWAFWHSVEIMGVVLGVVIMCLCINLLLPPGLGCQIVIMVSTWTMSASAGEKPGTQGHAYNPHQEVADGGAWSWSSWERCKDNSPYDI